MRRSSAAWVLGMLVLAAGTVRGQEGSDVAPPPKLVLEPIAPVKIAKPGELFDPAKSGRRIALRECIELALKANLELKVESFNPPIALEDIRAARSVFDPVFFSNASHSFRRVDTTPTLTETELLLGAGRPRSAYTETSTLHYDLGVRKRSITGATIELKWSEDRSRDDPQRLDSGDPRYANSASLSITQPLLRGAGPELNSIDILIAESSRDSTVFQLQRTIIDVATRVELRYYDLVLARENLETATTSLNVAVEQYGRNLDQLNAGSIPPFTALESKTLVESRREQLVVTQSAIRDAEDALKNLVAPQDLALLESVELIPTDNVDAKDLEAAVVDFNRSRANALRARPELASLRNQINARHLGVLKARNGLLPQLNATSSVSFDGAGASHHESVNNSGEFRYLSWSVGLALEIPLGNRAARASYDKSRLQYAQAAADCERAEADVVFEVRRAVRAIDTARERYRVALVSMNNTRDLFDSKKTRLDSGDITQFEYNQASEDYTRARNNTARAKIEFAQAFTRLRQAESTTLSYLERQGILVVPVAPSE